MSDKFSVRDKVLVIDGDFEGKTGTVSKVHHWGQLVTITDDEGQDWHVGMERVELLQVSRDLRDNVIRELIDNARNGDNPVFRLHHHDMIDPYEGVALWLEDQLSTKDEQ